jgi:hypothetical protein
MKKTILILTMTFLGTSISAKGPEKSDYEIAFQDGAISYQAEGFENSIKEAYEILIIVEKLQGKEINEARKLLIKRINAQLHTLGIMIKDIESGSVVSSKLYEYVKRENDRAKKTLKETSAGENYSEPDSRTKSEPNNFWLKLKEEREEKNWKFETKNEKLRILREKNIELALDTFIKYGNILKIECLLLERSALLQATC